MATCKSCKGDGYIQCPKCRGKGQTSKISFLKGLNPNEMNAVVVKECDLCSGSGRKKCGVCDGSGKT
jgi:DnaJ-class molecular chaperone